MWMHGSAEKYHYDGLGFKRPSSKAASSDAKRTRSSELHQWLCMPQSHNIRTNILKCSATLRWLTAELDAMSMQHKIDGSVWKMNFWKQLDLPATAKLSSASRTRLCSCKVAVIFFTRRAVRGAAAACLRALQTGSFRRLGPYLHEVCCCFWVLPAW